jgi:hypothetical protein
MPTQKAALIHDDGSAFKKITRVDVVVDSPSSYITTTDLYLGGLYNFEAIDGTTPYVGLGYAKVKGNWHKSYWRGYPGLGDSDEVSRVVVQVVFLESRSISPDCSAVKRSFAVNGTNLTLFHRLLLF